MTTNKTNPRNTLIVNFITCLAFEATRISGWQHRHSISGGVWDPGGSDPTLFEIVIDTWEPIALLVYLAFFSPLVVVASNNLNPKIRKSWFLISVIALIAICVCIPFSESGRYISTDGIIALIYVVIVPLPAAIFTIYGISTIIANKRIQSDAAKPRR